MGRGFRLNEDEDPTDCIDEIEAAARDCRKHLERLTTRIEELEAEKDSLLEQLSEANSLVSELQDRVRELETALEEECMGDDI